MKKKMIFAGLLLVFLSLTAVLVAFGTREKPLAPGSPHGNSSGTASEAGENRSLEGPQGIPQEVAEALTEAGIQSLKERVPIVDFTLPLLEGGSITLSELEGKVVFLNFWATWCPPCREEMPSMEKLHQRFKGKDFVILAVDLQEDEKTVADFVKKYQLSFPVALDSGGRIGGTYGVRGIPTSYIVDQGGGIVGAAVGGKDWNSPEVVAAFELLMSHGN